MYCNKCGNKLEDDMVFCNKCGNRIENTNEAEKNNKNDIDSKISSNKKNTTTQKRSKHYFLLAILILIFIFIIAVIMRIINSTNYSDITTSNNNDISSIKNVDENLITVEGLNNSKKEVTIKVNKNNFVEPINDDLYTIINEYLDNVIINTYMINALYDKQNNEFKYINYVVWCNDSDNKENVISVFRGAGELITYNIQTDDKSVNLVPNDTMNVIVEACKVMSDCNFKENYISFAITKNLNKDVYELLIKD